MLAPFQQLQTFTHMLLCLLGTTTVTFPTVANPHPWDCSAHPDLSSSRLHATQDPDKAQSADTGAFPVTQQPSSAPAAHLAGWEPGEVLEGMADAVEGAAAMPEGAAAVADQTQQGPHPRDPDPPGSTTSASTGGARVVPRSSSSGSVLANPLLQGSTGLLQALHGIQAMQDTPEVGRGLWVSFWILSL